MPLNETKSEQPTFVETSLNGVPQSDPVLLPSEPKVLDFIYHDARRIGSFLSQFHELGLIQEIKQTDSVGESESAKTSVAGGFRALAHGQAGSEAVTGSENREVSERRYDPFWKSARGILDILEENRLIQTDIWQARLGQFVRIPGALVMLDATMLKGAWEKRSIKNMISNGLKDKVPKNFKDQGLQLLLDLLSIIPHSVQCQFVGSNYNIWSTLIENSMVTSANDIVLKHGAFIPGNWEMLGIVDAFPDQAPAPLEDGTPGKTPDELIQEHAGTPVGTAIASFAPAVRQLIGRPTGFFGVTPLLIFREISG